MTKKVLVTGIGGNVGQGILRNIISLDSDIVIIGTNTKPVSGGNHLCDIFYQVPFSNTYDYIPTMEKICKDEGVDLIIPSTDYEVYYLALASDKLPPLSSSNASVGYTFLNKYKTWQEFNNLSIPFVETTLPSLYKDGFGEIIVKPAEGRGSREIYINPKDPKQFSDDYIIQKCLKGLEITTAFYITKNGVLLGFITFERSLESGTTTICEVTNNYDKPIRDIIDKIIKHFALKGSCNIQSIVDNKGNVNPFEINCRISGTNSIRGQFGFEDIKYTLEEHLYNKVPHKPIIKKGSATRILMDVIYPDTKLKDIKDKSVKHYIF